MVQPQKKAQPKGPGSNPLLRLLGTEAAAEKPEGSQPDNDAPDLVDGAIAPGAAAVPPAVTPESTAATPAIREKKIRRVSTREKVKRDPNEKPKGTYYIEEIHDIILEEIRLKLRKLGDHDADKSRLVREAIEDLAKKYEKLSGSSSEG